MSTSNISVVELEAQLRQAEARRAEVERQYAEALSNLRSSIATDPLEARQSKVRELEKKVALETVRVEELQLELASTRRTTSSSGATSTLSTITTATAITTTSTPWGHGGHGGHQTPVPSTTSSVTTQQQGSEIERIMAKIEQDNRILAELEHSRSTTLSAPECQWGISGSTNINNTLDPSVYGTSAVSAPVSPLPSQQNQQGIIGGNPNSINIGGNSVLGGGCQTSSNYQYAPNTCLAPTSTMSGLYSQTQFSSSAVTGGSVSASNYSSHPHHSYTSQVTSIPGAYTNHSGTNVPGGVSSYVNPLTNLTNQPYSNLIAATSALTNQQSTVFTNNTGQSGATTYNSALVGGGGGGGLTCHSQLPSGGGVGSSYTSTGLSNHTTFSNPLTSTLTSHTLGGYTSLGGAGVTGPGTSSLFNNNPTTYTNNPLVSSTNQWCSPTSAMTVKLKPLEEAELGRRIPTPVTPHAPNLWDRPLSRPTITTGGGLSDSGGGGDWGMGIMTDGQVDMLDIPGKGRCSVYIARFSYDPDLEAPEDELPVSAGDYLLVWSEPGAAYLDAELLDGRRGLVPAHFAQRLVGDDLLDFHQAVLSSLRDEESAEMLAADVQRLCELTDVNEEPEDETIDAQVGAPRQLTLERQLNKSVLISWTAPEPAQPGSQVESYHVYVDGVLKTTVKASERTRALVEGVDSHRPHRISVRSVTANRRTSRDAACTMVIGRDTQQLGPTAVRATHVTSSSAIISWLPANSNHQHVVCVNNVEVRTVKPGVYRHTITGLTPNTQYRVTVRAKHIRAQPAVPGEEPPCPASAHTDFRTLPKGLPDPPADIMVEAGPQDGTLLVTWHPVQAPHHPGSIVTGYAVYADGKKVTDVDSPTGDHALIDISKLLGLNPRHVTVRTKARDSQSADSVPTAIPPSVLRGGLRQQRQPHSGVPPHMRQQQRGGQTGGPQQQVIIEHEDNLSDKEIFPSGQMHHRSQGPGIPQIEITKDSASEGQLTEEDYLDGRRGGRGIAHHQGQQATQSGNMHHYQQQQTTQQTRNMQQDRRGGAQTLHGTTGRQDQAQYYQQQSTQQQNQQRGTGAQNRRGGQQQQGTSRPGEQGQAPTAPKKARWFVAMYDYDPTTMSPNPDACEEELPFSEGDSIKIWGDKDPDGFYWGECRGRRGYVPHNMVMEVDGAGQRSNDRDRWGDIYANMPVKRMVALYDYDPQELSPNVDSEVELSFTTGSIIHVYGEMDDDGFYMGELDGVRGLVPSNFLTEAPDQFQAPGSVGPGGVMMQQQSSGGAGGSMGPRSQRSMMGGGGGSGGSGGGSGVGGRGHGPGARGPPPPPRGVGDGPVGMSPSSAAGGMPPGATPGSRSGAPRGTKTDACPVVPCSQLDTTTNTVTTVSPPNTLLSSSTEQQQQAAMRNQQRGGVQRGGTIGGSQQQQASQQQQFQQSQQQQQQSNTFQTQNNQFTNQNQYQNQYMQQPLGSDPMNRSQQPLHKGTPSVLPNIQLQQQQQQGQPGQQQPQNATNAPNALMQKFTEMAAPGGDILSKGKELIFMKFGLGGK